MFCKKPQKPGWRRSMTAFMAATGSQRGVGASRASVGQILYSSFFDARTSRHFFDPIEGVEHIGI